MKKFFVLFLALSLLLCSLTACYRISPTDDTGEAPETSSTEAPADKSVIYPSEDSDSIYYSYATEVPDIIYSTFASENKLNGSPYYVEGTVIKVYDSIAEMLEEYGADTSDLDDSLYHTRIFIVETDNGEVAFEDLVTYVIQSVSDQFSDDPDSFNDFLASSFNGVTSEGYIDFPSAGELVTIYGFYDGFSTVFQMPIFYYGLTDYLHDLMASDTDTETYNFRDLISIEIPSKWGSASDNGDYTYFYPSSGMLMLGVVDGDYSGMEDNDELMEGFSSGFDSDYTQSECTLIDIDGGKTQGYSCHVSGTISDQAVDGQVVNIYLDDKIVTLEYFDYVTEDDYESGLETFEDIILDSVVILQDISEPAKPAVETATPTETAIETPAPTETATVPAKSEDIPTEYTNALRDAESYDMLLHMSKQAIYDQLTSEYGEGYSPEAAQYAIDNMTADWNANALAKAESYSDSMNMSKQAIYDQLISEYGEQFTAAEAQYAIDNIDADWYANALAKAQTYQQVLDMSKDEIYQQLTSDYGEQFTVDEAQYAIDHLN